MFVCAQAWGCWQFLITFLLQFRLRAGSADSQMTKQTLLSILGLSSKLESWLLNSMLQKWGQSFLFSSLSGWAKLDIAINSITELPTESSVFWEPVNKTSTKSKNLVNLQRGIPSGMFKFKIQAREYKSIKQGLEIFKNLIFCKSPDTERISSNLPQIPYLLKWRESWSLKPSQPDSKGMFFLPLS